MAALVAAIHDLLAAIGQGVDGRDEPGHDDPAMTIQGLHKGAQCAMQNPHALYGEPDLRLAGLSIWVLAREFPDSEDVWVRNWLIVHIRVETQNAVGDSDGAWLRSDELADFAAGLEPVWRDMQGSAWLLCIEPILTVNVASGPPGQIEIAIAFSPEEGSPIQCRFDGDRSSVGRFLDDCRRLVERFPVLGRTE